MYLFNPYRHKKTQFWSPLLLGFIAILSASVEYQSQNHTVARSDTFAQCRLITDIDVLDAYQTIVQQVSSPSSINTYPVRSILYFTTTKLDISKINYYLPLVRAGPTQANITTILS